MPCPVHVNSRITVRSHPGDGAGPCWNERTDDADGRRSGRGAGGRNGSVRKRTHCACATRDFLIRAGLRDETRRDGEGEAHVSHWPGRVRALRHDVKRRFHRSRPPPPRAAGAGAGNVRVRYAVVSLEPTPRRADGVSILPWQPVAKVRAAFAGRRIPADVVARRLHMPNMRPPHALSAGRDARLGATRDFHHGLLGRLSGSAVGRGVAGTRRLTPSRARKPVRGRRRPRAVPGRRSTAGRRWRRRAAARVPG